MNCGAKGHAAVECPRPRKEKSERPCFNCGQGGHEAKNCRKPKAVKAVEEKPQGRPEPVFTGCVTLAPPKVKPEPHTPSMGDFIRAKAPSGGNHGGRRFRPLTTDDLDETMVTTMCPGRRPPTLLKSQGVAKHMEAAGTFAKGEVSVAKLIQNFESDISGIC